MRLGLAARARRRGASLGEKALVVGLVAVGAVAGVGTAGEGARGLVNNVQVTLAAATGVSQPRPFDWPAVTAPLPEETMISASMVPPELYAPTDVAASGEARVSVAGGPWVSRARIAPGEGLRVRAPSPADFAQEEMYQVSVGGAAASWTVRTGAPLASCAELLAAAPDAQTGIYTLDPDGDGPIAPFQTTCEMTWKGGGWTMMLNNVDNATSMDLFADSIPADGLSVASSGTVGLDHYLDGSRELIWAVGSNVIVHVQENGSKPTFVAQPGRMCPSTDLRYVWTLLASDGGWRNRHRNQFWRCSGYGHDGTVAVNYVARGDDDGNYGPRFVFIGNGSSGYYNHGNRYDHDLLKYDGRGNFKDTRPSFWTNSTTHQLWLR